MPKIMKISYKLRFLVKKKNIFVPFLFFEKSKKYLEITLKYTLCPGLWTDGHTHRGTERKIDEDNAVAAFY